MTTTAKHATLAQKQIEMHTAVRRFRKTVDRLVWFADQQQQMTDEAYADPRTTDLFAAEMTEYYDSAREALDKVLAEFNAGRPGRDD